MDNRELAEQIYYLTEESAYQMLDTFEKDQMVDKTLVYCFIKAFYLHTAQLYIATKKALDFENIYFEYKENLKKYYQTNNPNLENELLDQVLNFFDNSFSLIDSVDLNNIEDTYEFRHYTIRVFELLRMILEKKSNAFIRENIFDRYIRGIIEESEVIFSYIAKAK